MKACTICGTSKNLDQFVKDRRLVDGYSSRCLLCERDRVRAWNRTLQGRSYAKTYNLERKVDHRAHYVAYKVQIKSRVRERCLVTAGIINSLKKGPCTDCKKSFPPFCMDFDHVRGEKNFDVGDMKSHSRKAVLAEITKCDLVCARCHRVRTDGRKPELTLPWKVRLRAKFDALKVPPCLDCRGTFPPAAMEFDHVRGEKLASLGNMFGLAWHRVMAEVAKCDLVCACCHRLRTEARRVVV